MKTAPGRKKVPWWVRVARSVGVLQMPLGDRGERAAARFLRKKGLKLIARNRVHGKGEIDIIALDANDLVFIEVRTRRSDAYMTPEQSIRYWKRKTLTSTVRRLMRKQKARDTDRLRARIDVVAVIWPVGAKRPKEIRWHRGVVAVATW
ncbi:MAG: YraN family protein [Phycisphaerae bacterium]